MARRYLPRGGTTGTKHGFAGRKTPRDLDERGLARSIESRVGNKVRIAPETGCWEWIGYAPNGYGVSQDQYGEPVSVHRLVYETLIGPIPDGCHLHHWCLNTLCCNPKHLEPLNPGDHRRAHSDISRPARILRKKKSAK